MKILITGIFLAGIIHNTLLHAQWTKTYGGAYDNDWGSSVQQTLDDEFIIVGSTASFGAGLADVYLIKTNSSGTQLWTKTYGGTNNDYGYSVQETFDNSFIIAGYTNSFGAGGYDVYLIKTNSYGDTLWTKTYGGTKNDYGYSVKQTSDSGFIITGYTNSFGAGSEDVYLIKTNPAGAPIWTKTYGGTDWDDGRAVQQTSDDGFIIAGRTYSFGNGNADTYLIKTDSSGAPIWTKTYGGTADDRSKSVQQTLDGGFIIAGSTKSFGAGGYDVYLIKTDSLGDELWTKTYGGTNNDMGESVQQTSDDGFIVAGSTNSFGTGTPNYHNVYLIKTNSSGNISVVEDSSPLVSSKFELLQNPVTNFVTIRYSLPSSTTASINIYNLSGRLIQTLPIAPDSHTMKLNLQDSDNKPLPSGIYFLTLTADNHKLTRKLTIIK